MAVPKSGNCDSVYPPLQQSQIARNDSVRNKLDGNEIMLSCAITQSHSYVSLASSAPFVMFASFANATSHVLVLSPQSGFAQIFAGSPTILVANRSRSRTSSGDSIRSRPSECPAPGDTFPVKSWT